MKTQKKKFDNKQFIKDLGIKHKELEPYNYEGYLEINPKLTKRMYNFLRGNGALWKVWCGKRVEINFENEILKRVWWLDTPENYAKRYIYTPPLLRRDNNEAEV
ncbi:MAG: hypothetical protein COB15_07790 [Flavobacteriales bacterium]|nr:MAG: hypothetical protein COB15_07790 [Flavobacteriales bacterium]